MARDSGVNTVTTSASIVEDRATLRAPYDALSDPAVDDLAQAAAAMWPPGPAWGTPDGEALHLDSVLGRFTRVLADMFALLYQRAWRLTRNATVQGVDELLPDWERDYGLPDNCTPAATSVAERLRSLEAKVLALAVITPEDFIRLAFSYGFAITIEEPAMFECGFSECGGEHTVGDVRQEIYWIVSVTDLAVDYFRVSESECGHDPLFSFGEAERLLAFSASWLPPEVCRFFQLPHNL